MIEADWVAELQYDISRLGSLAADIRGHLSRGRVVVLRNTPYVPVQLNTDDLSNVLGIPKDMFVVASGRSDLKRKVI